jgi:hypothetical protein
MAARYFLVTLLLHFLSGTTNLLHAADAPKTGDASNGWNLDSQSGGVALYSRLRSGSSLKEFKAIGEVDAPAHSVHKVINDVPAYPSFMPFTAECRLLKQDGDSMLTYQRLSPKICSDRDYTLRIHEKSWSGPNGPVYLDDWKPANELGPPEKKGILRVKVCEGSWLLEPAGPTKTRATYSVFTDSGGALPAFLANAASEIGIRKIFAAIRKQVKLPKYSVAPE